MPNKRQGWFGIDCSIDLEATAGLGLDPVVELDMPEGDAELVKLQAHGGAEAGARALTVPPGVVQQRLRPAVYVYELPTWLAHAFEARAPRCHAVWRAPLRRRGLHRRLTALRTKRSAACTPVRAPAHVS